MRFLHTSDLHLGRSLHGVSLLEEQQRFLDLIVDIAREHAVDTVLVAGDVYDRSFPPAESVVMFERFLMNLDHLGVTTVVISGNHDHADRLGYGSGLFRDRLHVLTNPAGIHIPAVLSDHHGDVLIYGIPYLEPEMVRRALSTSPDDLLEATHGAVVEAAMNRIRSDLAERGGSPRIVVVAHAFVVGGDQAAQESDSERPLRVGGVPSVPTAVFDGAHYVALGHLHRPQRPSPVGTSATLAYSGSPLRYSISERGHDKAVLIVDLAADGSVTLNEVPIPQPRAMAELVGTLEELLSEDCAEHRNSWVRLIVTDPVRPDAMIPQLAAMYPHALEYQHRSAHGNGGSMAAVHVDQRSEPIDVATIFVEAMRGSGPTDEEIALLLDVIDTVRREEAS